MMNIKDEIKKIVEKAAKKIGVLDVPILIEAPAEKSHGDYSTNVALVLGNILNKNPLEIAAEIVNEIKKSESASWRVEIASPGFINFYISKDFFIDSIKKVLKDKTFGSNKNLKGKKVIVEYTDPNPFKEFHIGHLMSNSIGESISRIFEFQGAKVKRANYQGDVGIHVAKAIWGVMHILKSNFPKENDLLTRKNIYLKNAYVVGAGAYDENDLSGLVAGGPNKEELRKQIQEINKKVYSREDKEINRIYDEGRKWSLEYFEKIYKKLGTKFDYYFFESEVADFGKKVVEDGLKKAIFEIGEKGALVFKGEKFGLHTRVFVNSEGLPTYEAKELGLANIKYQKYKYDDSVIITGNEINEYFKVLLCAMGETFPELAKKTKHLGHGMMRLPEGKMSSRTGKVVTFESLLSKVEGLVREKIENRDLSEKEKIAEKVAISALKYSILKQSVGSDIVYNMEKSISFDGDSGPYLQYSYARARSVLRKAKTERIKASFKNIPSEISELEKDMSYFPEVVEKAGKEYDPHFIVLYLTELAREFNNYYGKNKIVDKNDKFSSYRVAITEAFSIIIKNGLWLLGIEAPDRM